MSNTKNNNTKDKLQQSLLMGALASSFGIFISKVLGLFYYSPLSSLAGESNMAFYSIVYTYYDLLLQISSAGIPFAIASLVATYIGKKDYKTALLVKKLGTSIVLALSVFISFFFVLAADALSKQSLGSSAPISDINNLKLLFYILTVAVIVVPFLSAIRAYSQGLKRLDIYGASQVLEQLTRVLTILIGAFVFVKVVKLDSIWAIYSAIAAASIGAIIAIIFTKYFSKDDVKHIEELAKQQDFDPSRTNKQVIQEILSIGIPYLIISFLSTAGPLINTTFFLDYVTKVHGSEVYESMKLASGILQANVAKIANIPSVLALGFGSGMVPYLAESLGKNDNKKITEQINSILDTTCIILVPMCFIFAVFARDIYYIFYGNTNLDLGANLFAVSVLQIFLGTIAPIFTSIMMSLKLRKQCIITLIVSFLVKLATFFPLVNRFDALGMIYSSALYYVLQILMCFYCLKIYFDVNIKNATYRLIKILLCSIFMIIPAYAIYQFIPFAYDSRIIDILLLGGLGLLMLVFYYLATKKSKLLSEVFKMDDVSISKLITKFRS